MIYSFSSIDTYLRCPRKFELKYIKRMRKQEKNDNFAIGEGLHQFLEAYSKNPDLTLRQCVDIYTKAALAEPSLESPEFVEMYEPMIKMYRDSGQRLNPLVVGDEVFTEKKGNVDCFGTQAQVRIDIITRKHTVADYKSGAKPYEQKDADEVLSGKGLQLSIYSLYYYERFKRAPGAVAFQVVLKDLSGVQNVISRRTEDDIIETKKLVRNIDLEIQAREVFDKKCSNFNCKKCEYRGEC